MTAHSFGVRGYNKGFSLIEVLIVVAMIGILASLVLAGVTASRNKAYDARIRNGLGQIRWLAEIVYDSQGASYEDWTQDATIVEDLEVLLKDIDVNSGDDPEDETYVTTVTQSQPTDYCISAPKRSQPSRFFCIDRSGLVKDVASPCPPDDPDGDPLVCPAE